MDFALSEGAADLRRELRSLIEAQLPPGFMGAFTDRPEDLATAQAFCRMLADRGLLTLSWPEEFGGRGGSIWDQTVVREEMWAHHEPRGAQYMGVNWVGPTIMRHGTPEQQARHLPAIGAGDVIWCQGFSEPDAGSDLSALRTSARPDGDDWVINGQKVWTSYALMAQWCFLLARSEAASDKHEGISVFLVPMSADGVEVRPIASMLGPHHLNEVFFTDVRVGADSVLGGVGQGWSIVREVLAFERVGIARYARCERLLQWAPDAVGERWESLPQEVTNLWTEALVRTRAVRLLAYRIVAAQVSGAPDPTETAVYRIAATALDQFVADVLMNVVGAAALPAAGDAFTRAVEDHWRYAQAATVSSGTIEMQRNLIGRKLARGAA